MMSNRSCVIRLGAFESPEVAEIALYWTTILGALVIIFAVQVLPLSVRSVTFAFAFPVTSYVETTIQGISPGRKHDSVIVASLLLSVVVAPV